MDLFWIAIPIWSNACLVFTILQLPILHVRCKHTITYIQLVYCVFLKNDDNYDFCFLLKSLKKFIQNFWVTLSLFSGLYMSPLLLIWKNKTKNNGFTEILGIMYLLLLIVESSYSLSPEIKYEMIFSSKNYQFSIQFWSSI